MKLFDWVTFKEADEKIPYNGGPYAILIRQTKGGANMFYIPNCTNGDHFTGIYSMNHRKIGYLYDKEITPIKEE